MNDNISEKQKKNFVYDVIVIGAGPFGLASLNYVLRKSKNVLCIEKLRPLDTLKGLMKGMRWQSQWQGCKLSEDHDLGISKEDMYEFPTIEDLIECYEKFIKDHQLLKYIVKDNVLNVKRSELDEKVRILITEKGKYLTKNIILCAGTNRIPKKPNFPITDSNIVRYVSDYDTINKNKKYKNVVLIGGGASSRDLAIHLKSPTILFRKTLQGLIDRSIKYYGRKKEDFEHIDMVQYKKIKGINRNIIYYDDKDIKFDLCVILIGYQIVPPFDITPTIVPYMYGMDIIDKLFGSKMMHEGKVIFQCKGKLKEYLDMHIKF